MRSRVGACRGERTSLFCINNRMSYCCTNWAVFYWARVCLREDRWWTPPPLPLIYTITPPHHHVCLTEVFPILEWKPLPHIPNAKSRLQQKKKGEHDKKKKERKKEKSTTDCKDFICDWGQRHLGMWLEQLKIALFNIHTIHYNATEFTNPDRKRFDCFFLWGKMFT